MKKILFASALTFSLSVVAAQDSRVLGWDCIGSLTSGNERFSQFEFEQLVEDYRGDAKVTEQLIHLNNSNGLVDLYGPTPSKVIDLNSKYVCPNSGKEISTTFSISPLDQEEGFEDNISPLKIEVSQGCGDGFGEIALSGFCRFSH